MKAVNLIPSEQRSGGAIAARSGGAAYLVLGLLGGLAVLALLYGLSQHQLAGRRAEVATLSMRAHQVEAEAAQLAPYASFMATREQRLRSIAELIGGRFDWSNAMGELSRVLPSDVALTTLQGAVGATSASLSSTPSASAAAKSSAVSSATPPGTTPSFTVTGCGASQSVVAQTLVRLRLIAGVSNVALQSSTKTSNSSSSSGGSCPGNYPVFTVQVTFEALPTPTAPSAAALTSDADASAGRSPSADPKRTVSTISKGKAR
jgi:Tfp pilus assembly protein PilN